MIPKEKLARDVRNWKKHGLGYEDVSRLVQKNYGINLSREDYNAYVSKRSGRIILPAALALTALITAVGGVIYLSRNGEEAEIRKPATSNIEQPSEKSFSPYFITKITNVTPGYTYVMDFEPDGKPDGMMSEKSFRAAIEILKLDTSIDPKSLIRSLYDIHADEITLKSLNQIITSKGKPPQFAIYKFEKNTGFSVNAELTNAWSAINKQIVDAFYSNSSVDEKKKTVEGAFRSNPEAASWTIDIMTNGEMDKYLRDSVGMEVTNMYSGIVRGNLSDAARDAASLNISGAVGNAFAAWFNTQMAKAAVQGVSGMPAYGESSSSGERPALSGYYEYKSGNTVYHFTTAEERDEFKKWDEEQMKDFWPIK